MATTAKTTKRDLKRFVAKEVSTQMVTDAVESKEKVYNPQLKKKPPKRGAPSPKKTSTPKPAKKKK
jgi:hypothetical protein